MTPQQIQLAIYGAVHLGILNAPPYRRPDLLDRIADGRWRLLVEEYDDDVCLVIQVEDDHGGHTNLHRVTRAELGLPAADADTITLAAHLVHRTPDDPGTIT